MQNQHEAKLSRAGWDISLIGRPGIEVRPDNPKSFKPLLERIDGAHVVALGKSSHGTHEYLQTMASISKQLIEKKGFQFVAVEWDQPDCQKINEYVKSGKENSASVSEVIRMGRFPEWMWGNEEMQEFVGWLKSHNDKKKKREDRVGFFGLDVQNEQWESLQIAIDYLRNNNITNGQSQAFLPFNANVRSAQEILQQNSPARVLSQIAPLVAEATRNKTSDEALFAKLAVNELFASIEYLNSRRSWNPRADHFYSAFEEIRKHYSTKNESAKGIVWAHVLHAGDARQTTSSERSEVSLGQRLREHMGSDAFLLGMFAYQGSVRAANVWGEKQSYVKPILQAPGGMWEHDLLTEEDRQKGAKKQDETPVGRLHFTSDFIDTFSRRVHRTIGVEYEVPGVGERANAREFDAWIVYNNSNPLRPLVY